MDENAELKAAFRKFLPSSLVAFSLGLLFIFFVASFGWINVQPTEVAVRVDKIKGHIDSEPLGVGYHFFNKWFTDMVIYKVSARSFPSQSMASENQKEYNMVSITYK